MMIKLKKILIVILLVLVGVSNIPINPLLDLLDQYIKNSNVIDPAWHASRNKNVVDKFISLQRRAAKLRTPEALAAVGDARMQYGASTNATPQTRFFTNSTNSWGAAGATVAGTASIGWTVSKESPTEDVTVMATQSTTGKLDIFCRTGSTWTKDISNVTIGTTAATRRFDVEFEKTSGVPMVLYSTNAAGTNELAYYRKTGAGCGAGSWTGPTTLNPTVVTGIVLWVELEARQTSGSNVMAAAFSDANATQGGKLESMIWNGSWGNESPAGAANGWSDLSIELQGTAGANAAKVFDLAFETNSGDLFISWGTSLGANGTNGWRYATCGATLPCTWSGVLTPAGPLDDATNVACAPDPGSDAIACIAQGNAGADLSAWTWTGTAVGATTAASADATLLATAAGDMHVDIDWVVNGSQRMAVGVYAETTTGYKYIYYDTVGAAWRINGTTGFTITGAPATAMQSVQVTTNPNDKTKILVNFTDANSDLWSKRLFYNGAAGGATTALSTWSNSDAGVALEATVSSITSQPFWFDWIKYAAANSPPTLSLSQPDGTGDTVNVGDLFNVTYSLSDTDNVVTAAFYYDIDNTGLNGSAITGACATAAEGSGVTCSWNTTGMTPGSYYVYGITNDGVNPQVSAYSSGMITINAVPTLTVSTSGTQATNLNSGDANQHIGGAGTAAFRLQISSGSATVTSVKLTDTGTVAFANLTSPRLYYESVATCAYNGSESNVAGTYTGETVTFTLASVAIPVTPNFLCLYYVFDVSGANTSGGQTIITAITNPSTDVAISGASNTDTVAKNFGSTTTIRPQITGYTNTTETGLNYSAACTNCGARIGPGSAYRQTITISGYGFGADPGLGSRDTATNKVEIVGVSTNMLDDDGSANTNVSAWSNTSITIRTDTNITGDTDTNWGTDFGGAAALKVTAGSQIIPTNFNFYIFPQVTSLTVCNKAGFPAADNAREYDSADSACPNGLKDGEIILNGTRFGTSVTGGYVRMLGCDATTCSGPTGSATTTSWSNTAITAQVPTVIANSTYTGSLAMQQGTGSGNKTHTYTATGFRVLPRITSNNPVNGSAGDTVQINGDHLCQTGTCPTSPNRSTATDNVKFGSTQALDGDFTSGGPCAGSGWGHTEICVKVPAATPSGSQPTIARSNNYDSDDQAFNVNSPTPSDPTSLNQFKNSGLTQSIAVGDTASATPIYLAMIMEVPGISGGTLYPQIEYKPVGTSFSCSGGGACGSAAEGTGVAGPGPIDCSQTGNNCAISISPTDNVYHWQARVRHNKSGSDYYSNWVSFGGNAESATDFKIDTTAPAISSGPTASQQTNSVTIDWGTSGEQSTSQVQYNKTGTFVNNCATNNDCTALDVNLSYTHSVSLSNLDSGTLYYYRVRSKDAAGNEVISSVNSFTTSSVSQPAKTTQFHIWGKTGSVIGGNQASTTFSVFMPENATSTKSAFVEINGVSLSNGTNNVQIQVNSQAVKTYVINSNETQFKILYKVDPGNINIDPTANIFYITPSLDTYIVSSKIYITYSYTP